jgi:hypothetical protein
MEVIINFIRQLLYSLEDSFWYMYLLDRRLRGSRLGRTRGEKSRCPTGNRSPVTWLVANHFIDSAIAVHSINGQRCIVHSNKVLSLLLLNFLFTF